jgi:hypothetical protein
MSAARIQDMTAAASSRSKEEFMLPATSKRVKENTAEKINEKIRKQTECRVSCLASAPESAIDLRLGELEREWDIERVLEANAAGFSLAGLLLGITSERKWLLLPVTVAGFLLQHAIQGWCPPVPVFRRLGVRTMEEINFERYALKALRGDFDGTTETEEVSGKPVQEIIRAVGL